MEQEDKICIICDEILNENLRTIPKEGMKNYIQASLRRQDNKYLTLRKFNSITIHENCSKNYTNETKIAAYLRRLGHLNESLHDTRSTESFNFASLCFICGEDASDDFIEKQKKYPANRRKIVRLVHTNATRDNLIENFKKSSNRMCIEVINRISSIRDLTAVGARYHDACNKNLFITRRESSQGLDTDASKAAKFVCEYILSKKMECQFSLKAILANFDGETWPDMQYLKKKLTKTFGDEIVIHSSKEGPIISFTNTCGKILTENWYKNKNRDEKLERLRVVQTAAKIILEDMRSKFYDTNQYPAPDCFLEKADSDIPETLKVLLDEIILKNKTSDSNYQTKVTSIAHCIIAATRPRSFISCIQVALGSMLNKKYGSKDLIRILNSLGFCCSYDETQLFESSLLAHPQQNVYNNAYTQFVFDNADHNVNTIDGRNTFHAMGGIQIVTPHTSVTSNKFINRLSLRTPSQEIGRFGKIDLEIFHKPTRSGMENIIVQDLHKIRPVSLDIKLSKTDFLWLFGKHEYSTDFLGWNGYMESITNHLSYAKSRILFLPFVNAQPSNYDTIYTVLNQARLKSSEIDQKHCFVTFDQPLYYKAREIIECCKHELTSVIVRLGGFHLLMSFMGTIGFIMDGSGLKELFCTIFAENSVDKILNGHAYSRSVRGNILAHLALGKIMLSSFDLTNDENSLLLDKLTLENSTLTSIDDEHFLNIYNKFLRHVEELKQRGPTAKLWLQYYDMVTVMKQFIQAERMGNWNLHLESIRKMLPFFHASGHYLYAKSCQLYLQDMYELEEKMDPLEYENFTTKGYFTIRRSDKFWSGIWSDMSIEQVLMRSMKTSGGLTHGRGITDSVLAKWVLTMPFLIDVSNSMQSFCNVAFITSEQHVDARPSRIQEDNRALDLMLQFFTSYDPFVVSDAIISLSSGVKGNENINCHNALEIGLKMMNSIVGNNFNALKFQRKNRVMPLQAIHSIKLKNENVIINPALIFQRISIAMEGTTELKDCFAYELAPYPLSMFDNGIMRKTEKSKLYDHFQPMYDEPSLDNSCHVIDGGFLLHKVVWPQKETFEVILDRYVTYVTKYFAANSFIIFDGYPENLKSSTKGAERLRRQARNLCAEIQFDLSMTATTSQEKFLSNDRNKNRFILYLREKLEAAGFHTKQAGEDADTVIVETAINVATDEKPAIIVAEDIDVLVIFSQRAAEDKKIYFLKPSRGKTAERLYNSTSFIGENVKNLVAFIHAFTGCDTTSAFFKQGKAKIIKLLEKNTSLNEEALIFNKTNATAEEIENAGKKIIAAMYGGTKSCNLQLNELRYLCFKSSSTKKAFNLAMLPPTELAAKQHTFRAYYQVQQWLGNSLDPTQWGWSVRDNKLQPTYTTDLLVPDNILRDISCKCTKGCTKSCSCVKHGLQCSDYCAGCHGQTCKNCEKNVLDNIDIEDSSDVDERENDVQFDVERNMLDEDCVSDNEDSNDEIPCKKQKLT
ncbi:jg2186 [Pararge aegeria aegeria]|uniref:Jg2186 protein n=1 Tax=Pararge aegeria aegeria TaxID=348720 RepID=A0A8S4QUR9_9NEOP|nr:jg2186 [Pararge aegeria aegeria]